jgi:hypothetical protein
LIYYAMPRRPLISQIIDFITPLADYFRYFLRHYATIDDTATPLMSHFFGRLTLFSLTLITDIFITLAYYSLYIHYYILFSHWCHYSFAFITEGWHFRDNIFIIIIFFHTPFIAIDAIFARLLRYQLILLRLSYNI